MSKSQVAKGTVRLLVDAGKASPSPAIGQALGPLGVNMMDFCKQFNERTTTLVSGTPTPVLLEAYQDRTFSFVTKTPRSSWFLKRVAGVDKGSGMPGHSTVGEVSLKEVFEIAAVKKADVGGASQEAVVRSLIGTAKSMGITVVRG